MPEPLNLFGDVMEPPGTHLRLHHNREFHGGAFGASHRREAETSACPALIQTPFRNDQHVEVARRPESSCRCGTVHVATCGVVIHPLRDHVLDPKELIHLTRVSRSVPRGTRSGRVWAMSPVQVRNPDAAGVRSTDGPFLRSDLPVAGFAIIEADSMEEAVKKVSQTPCAVAHGVVEVWPLET